MRSLIFINFCLLNLSVFAEPSSFGYSFTQLTTQGRTSVNQLNEIDNLSSAIHDMNYSSGLINNTFRVRFSNTLLTRDVDNFIIPTATGEINLSDSFDGEEYIMGGGFDFVFKSFTFGLDTNRTITNSPLATRSMTPSLTYNNYNSGTIVKYSYLHRTDDRIEREVTNPETRTTTLLSGELNRKVHRMEAEQIISESIRARVTGRFFEESEDRPSNYSFGIGGLFALSDSFGVFTQYERITESSDFQARDGTGQFGLDSYILGASYEITYDILAKVVYTAIIETEEARFTNPRQRIGTDAIALGFDTRFKRILPTVLLTYERSNTDRDALLISGGFTWEI